VTGDDLFDRTRVTRSRAHDKKAAQRAKPPGVDGSTDDAAATGHDDVELGGGGSSKDASHSQKGADETGRTMKRGRCARGREDLRTSVFVSDEVARLMRYHTWQTDETDEPLLDSDESVALALPICAKESRVAPGLGAFAVRALQQSEFIGEYTGEIILAKDLESKERRDSAYIFDLGDGFVVDARPRGNTTRRMNHSAQSANVFAKRVNHRGVRKVCMYAARRIEPGEECLFDYGPLYAKHLLA
jgi:hypothetical protein